jgi:hypothetical protein
MTFADFQAQLVTLLQVAVDEFSGDDRDRLIKQAITQRYSKDRPREITSDVAGNATNIIALPIGPSSEPFEENFSVVRSIEYPIGSVPPSYILDSAWQMYRIPAGLRIMLVDSAPPASASLRINWTLRHKSDGTTVYSEDFEAVCDYAASLGFDTLAAKYTQSRDSSIQADAVNWRSKGSEYLSLAKKLRQRYFEHMGIPDGGDVAGGQASGIGPAIAMGDMDNITGAGVDRITHPRGR